MLFSENGSVLVSGSLDETIRLWNVRSGQALSVLKHDRVHPINAIALSPSNASLAECSFDTVVRVWDFSSKGKIFKALHAISDESVGFGTSQDHKSAIDNVLKTQRKLALDPVAPTVDVQEVIVPRVLKQHTAAVVAVSYSPDGRNICSASHDHVGLHRYQLLDKSFSHNVNRRRAFGMRSRVCFFAR